MQELSKIAKDLVIWPNPVLNAEAKPVKNASQLKQSVDLYYKLIDHINAVGLAAPQVGLSVRFFVLDDRQGLRLTCFNPSITGFSENTVTLDEGCLSIPGQFMPVERPLEIDAAWENEAGETVSQHLTGLAARIFQHEFDHLNGTTIVDYQTRMRRNIILRKMNKLKRRIS